MAPTGKYDVAPVVNFSDDVVSSLSAAEAEIHDSVHAQHSNRLQSTIAEMFAQLHRKS